jgi:hypothetical protein
VEGALMSNRHLTGEGDLVAAMFHRAFADACESPPVAPGQRANGFNPTLREALDAWRFLTSTGGAWAEMRTLWAGLAGVEPGIVREEALRRGPGRAVRVALMAGEMALVERPTPRGSGVPYTDAEVHTMRQMAAEKHGPKAIAAAIGRSPRGVERRLEIMRREARA